MSRSDLMELSMRSTWTSERDNTVGSLAVEDEDMASRSPVRLLITAPTQQAVETLARRVHETAPRARFPFVHTWAGDLPVGLLYLVNIIHLMVGDRLAKVAPV
jgi:hypothetical protein